MDDVAGLLLFALASLVLSIIALVKVASLKSGIEQLKRRLGEIESRGAVSAAQQVTARPETPKSAIPPPLPEFVKSAPVSTPVPLVPRPSVPPSVVIDWESILGVKLFAWIGGFALFLGVVFFIKYAFENNWITAGMRIVAGAIIGTLLVVVSLVRWIRRYRIPAQSLCVTGILILYADIYAAHLFYGLIPLTVATVLMWIITCASLAVAAGLNAQSVAWLAVVGGFLTPVLFRTQYESAGVLFSYIGILNCGIAAVSVRKRWHYLIFVAAIGSITTEFMWAADFFGHSGAEEARVVFLVIQALFLGICIGLVRGESANNWTIAAAAVAGFAPLLAFIEDPQSNLAAWDCGFVTLLLSAAGLIAIAAAHHEWPDKWKGLAAIVALALFLTWLAEWSWWTQVIFAPRLNQGPVFIGLHINSVKILHVAIFLLFAAVPYLCGTRRAWPWMIAAIAGPLQFWFVYKLLKSDFYHEWVWLLPIIFALPASGGVCYLIKKQGVTLGSADSRLATQGAAVIAFVSLVFPVQFEREWITLGWAIEGLALIVLFRWIPNRRLRAAAIIVLCAAFVRLAFNPAVLQYHPRARLPILNWYLYAYGITAICFFLSARWFGEPREKEYERAARPLLYSLCGIVLFLLMNIEIADYFSIGPTLTFSFSGNFARDMTYTIAWSVFALALLIIGVTRNVRPVRFVAIGLLCVAFAKLFLHDLDSLNQLYRIAAFVTVAFIAIVASFVYQRFLSPEAKKT
jgi:uncharacterized membrane protein